MPTGYTAIIEDSPEEAPFNVFVWGCASVLDGWGRDNDGYPPVELPAKKSFDTRGYYQERIEENLLKEKELLTLTDEELEAKRVEEIEESLKSNHKSLEKAREIDRRYASMRVKVMAWVPPPGERGTGLKKFMLDQLGMHHSMVNFYEEAIRAFRSIRNQNISEYRAALLTETRKDIARNREHLADEIARDQTQARNEFMRALHQSVPRPE